MPMPEQYGLLLAGPTGYGIARMTCAVVGGITAAGLGRGDLPGAWRQVAEPLPEWINLS
jgi:hypothetical protein